MSKEDGKPKILISHGNKYKEPYTYVAGLLALLGFDPIIVEEKPKQGKDVDSLVEYYLSLSVAAVIVATPDIENNGVFLPSQNVINEIGRCQQKFSNRIIYLKEESTELPATVTSTYYTFTLDNFTEISKALLIELRAMGLFENYYEDPEREYHLRILCEDIESLKELIEKQALSSQKIQEVFSQGVLSSMSKLSPVKGGD